MRHFNFRIVGISLVFIAAIFFPFLNDRLTLIPDIKSFENRRLAQEPAFDINHLDSFPDPYARYYNDTFNLRNRFIQYFNYYKIVLFRKSPLLNNLTIGTDGWLYSVGNEMDSYMGRNKLNADELESFKLELEYRKKYLEERGIKFYFMVVPCKASIHTEHIGYEYYRMSDRSWGEELNDYLNKNSTIKPINAFGDLREAKKNNDLYFRLDNHWNSVGAFHASNSVIRSMQKDFPDLRPLSVNDFSLVAVKGEDGNLQKMLGPLGIYSEIHTELQPKNGFKAQGANAFPHPPLAGFPYPWEYEAVKEIAGSKKPRLLIISDSFGKTLFPYIAENFSHTTKIFDGWEYKLNEDIVANEKPDAVLLMIDEPILRNFLKFQSRLDTK